MESKMKMFGFIIFLSVLTSSAFGQQFLWKAGNDTAKIRGAKIIPLDKVTKEVLKFYSQYKYYCDYSGYSKKTFSETFQDGDWVNEITDLIVAYRENSGNGSFVAVTCVSKENV